MNSFILISKFPSCIYFPLVSHCVNRSKIDIVFTVYNSNSRRQIVDILIFSTPYHFNFVSFALAKLTYSPPTPSQKDNIVKGRWVW